MLPLHPSSITSSTSYLAPTALVPHGGLCTPLPMCHASLLTTMAWHMPPSPRCTPCLLPTGPTRNLALIHATPRAPPHHVEVASRVRERGEMERGRKRKEKRNKNKKQM
ncbi:hypothetical protein GUJ93_ZPchr0002g25799 [Zizania palustris]|uniref:Uncharacterized protein n=1 Tax=Zizania palustris TaxID=103762 RepID=A0A8J5RJ67_ZIZPA|nr:hypothetical protein GUJ93_ZPchr0002g25799 [Zizania palustris]